MLGIQDLGNTAASLFNQQSTSASTKKAGVFQLSSAANTTAAASTSASSASTTSSTDSSDITSSDFLTLLVSEMKNQDPTQPTDPQAYVQQLVGVNSLQQLISINQDLGG